MVCDGVFVFPRRAGGGGGQKRPIYYNFPDPIRQLPFSHQLHSQSSAFALGDFLSPPTSPALTRSYSLSHPREACSRGQELAGAT